MCRMIGAVGAVPATALREALVGMAANINPRHDHERRARGADFTHDDGWGAAWLEGTTLRTHRRPASVRHDPEAAPFLDRLETPLLLLHARRASRGRPKEANTHPFTAHYLGREWAFCHNGTVRDHTRLRRVPGIDPEGGTDSELLFHHFLNRIGGVYAGDLDEAIEPALRDGIALLGRYTAAHGLLATAGRLIAIAARHPKRSEPEYHALWAGRGTELRVVSSEPVDGLGCEWTRIEEPDVVLMEVPS